MCLLPLEFLTESWRGLKLGVSHPQGWLGSGKIASLEGRPLKEKQSASEYKSPETFVLRKLPFVVLHERIYTFFSKLTFMKGYILLTF